MKEQLLYLSEMRDKDSVERFPEVWCFEAMNSGIHVLMKLGVTIALHRTGLLNYFDYEFTTAKVVRTWIISTNFCAKYNGLHS